MVERNDKGEADKELKWQVREDKELKETLENKVDTNDNPVHQPVASLLGVLLVNRQNGTVNWITEGNNFPRDKGKRK